MPARRAARRRGEDHRRRWPHRMTPTRFADSPDPQRRSLLKAAVVAINGLIASALGVPVFGYVLGPLFRKPEPQWVEAGKLADFGASPVSRRLKYVAQGGFRELERTRNVWVSIQQGAPTVFSSECTHVGCNVLWKDAEDRFICPCHGGVFSLEGEVLDGPPPAPLNRLPNKVENGSLYIQV